MKVLIYFIVFFSSNLVSAQNACSPKINLPKLVTLLEETKNRYFPELANETIGVTTFRSDAYFLQAQPEVKTLIGKRSKRKYNVQLNLKLLDCPPTDEALEAILVHELEHVRDYTGWSSTKIASHGIKYSTSLKFRARYERSTDAKVLEKGLNIGLAGYRVWVYQWLSAKELKRKAYIYLTPEEILN